MIYACVVYTIKHADMWDCVYFMEKMTNEQWSLFFKKIKKEKYYVMLYIYYNILQKTEKR